MQRTAIVVPLKPFDSAKSRLRAGGLTDVTALARSLATGVLLAASPRPAFVVGESPDLADFAREVGATYLGSSATTLNEAVHYAYREVSPHCDVVVIAHGDLQFPSGLGEFAPGSGVTIVTDLHGRGTNVLAVPANTDFRFHYGPTSARDHHLEAERCGLAVTVVTQHPWQYDLDEPSDMQKRGSVDPLFHRPMNWRDGVTT